MTELKTLKDITIPEVLEETIFGNRLTERVVLVSFLKAEAVKWIKRMQNNWHELGNHGDDNFAPESLAFMKFFNITEEELAK